MFSCVSTARLRLVPDFAELFDDMQEQNMQEFMSHSKASELVKLCMRDIAAAGPAPPGLAAKWCKTSLTHPTC
jgi:hypothetical protein